MFFPLDDALHSNLAATFNKHVTHILFAQAQFYADFGRSLLPMFSCYCFPFFLSPSRILHVIKHLNQHAAGKRGEMAESHSTDHLAKAGSSGERT